MKDQRWKDIVASHNSICYYCGCEVFVDSKKRSHKRPMATRDHVIPRSVAKGSRTVPACPQCNEEKAALTLEEFRVVKAFQYGQISGVQFKFPGEVPNESTIATGTKSWYTKIIKWTLDLTSRKEK